MYDGEWQDGAMDWFEYPVSANVSLLFGELPYLERFRAAADAGFSLVETWWPFPSATPSPAEVDDFLRAVEVAGVSLTGLNVFAGDMPAGERGIACDPERADEFEGSLTILLGIARATGCRAFNLLHGQIDPTRPREIQDAQALRSYRTAADAVAEIDGMILVEPLARGLNGSYPLETAGDALRLIRSAGSDRLGLLFDTFHLGSNDADLAAIASEHAHRIGHVQLADAPGRGEPGSGVIDFAAIGRALRDNGYRGSVAAEYRPTRATPLTLQWLDDSRDPTRLS